MVDTYNCPMIKLFLPLALNIALLLATADRCRLTIITETEQDFKLDIHLYNDFNIFYLQMVTDMSLVHGNISEMSTEMSETKLSSMELKKHLDSVEFVTTTIRSDVAGLTTKIYNIKTSLFEQSNEMSTIKATQVDITLYQVSLWKVEPPNIESYFKGFKRIFKTPTYTTFRC